MFETFATTFSRTGMGPVIGSLEPVGRQVGVNLRGRQMRVPKQLLHASQVGSSVQQMCCIAVTQLVRCELRVQPCQGQV